MLKQDDEIEFWQVQEWTVVYLNGKFVQAGDHYGADKWLQKYAGITVVEDADGGRFAMIDDRFGHAHPTLAKARAARAEHENRKARAAELRRHASEMLAEAERIETDAAK
jgi:hypothetical protein